MAGGVKFVCVFGGSAGGEIALHNADKPSCSAGGSAGGGTVPVIRPISQSVPVIAGDRARGQFP